MSVIEAWLKLKTLEAFKQEETRAHWRAKKIAGLQGNKSKCSICRLRRQPTARSHELARQSTYTNSGGWMLQLNDRNKLIQKFIQINSRFLISSRVKFLSSWLLFVSSEKLQGEEERVGVHFLPPTAAFTFPSLKPQPRFNQTAENLSDTDPYVNNNSNLYLCLKVAKAHATSWLQNKLIHVEFGILLVSWD